MTGFEEIQEAEEQTFTGLETRNTVFRSRRFYDCVFERCAFVETQFKDCTFSNCTFKDCDLSLVRVDGSDFTNVVFEDCKVIGVNWTVANWDGYLSAVHFVRSSINYSTFIGLERKKMIVRDCVAHDVDFAEADLTGADFRGTDLQESRFWQTDLTEVDFTGATHYAIDATLNTLKQTKFSLPEAMSLLHSLDIVLTDSQE